MAAFNIFDAASWATAEGGEVPSLTVITADDIRSGRVRVRDGADGKPMLETQQVLEYLEMLTLDKEKIWRTP